MFPARPRTVYLWDRDLAAAIFADIAIVEVALRNSVHRAISTRYGDRWWAVGGIPLDGRSEGDVNKAWRALPSHVRSRPNDSAVPGRLVARLMFGFWRDLLDSGGYRGAEPRRSSIDYEQNWRDVVRLAFPGGRVVARLDGVSFTRAWALEQVSIVHALRNRVAHHEPLVRGFPLPGQSSVRVSAQEGFAAYLKVARMIDFELASWLESNSEVPRILRSRPSAERRKLRAPRLR